MSDAKVIKQKTCLALFLIGVSLAALTQFICVEQKTQLVIKSETSGYIHLIEL